jgi:hypothetical protein
MDAVSDNLAPGVAAPAGESDQIETLARILLDAERSTSARLAPTVEGMPSGEAEMVLARAVAVQVLARLPDPSDRILSESGACLDPLGIRRRLGRDRWGAPRRFGDGAGWAYVSSDGRASIIVTAAVRGDGLEWTHASIARDGEMPAYADLKALHGAVWPDSGWAYQVFAPPDCHVCLHEHALHLWGRSDGRRVLPNFGAGGTI